MTDLITHLTTMTLKAFIAWLQIQTDGWKATARLETVKDLPDDLREFTPRTLDDWLDTLWSASTLQVRHHPKK